MEINKFKKYEKIKNNDSSFFFTIKSIFKLLKGKKILFFFSLLLIIIAEIAIVIVPFYIKDITENINDINHVLKNCNYLIVLYISNFLFSFIGSLLLGYIAEVMTYKLKSDIYDKIVTIPFSKLQTFKIGKITSMILYDTDTISQSLSNNVISMIVNIVSILGALICSLIISPILSIFLLIPLLLSFIRTFYISKIMRKKYYLKSVSLSNYENELLEWINGKIVIDSYNLENDFDAKLEKEGNMYFDSALTAEKYGSSISPFSHLIQHSCIVIISIMALLFVNLGITTIAIYSAFILYSKKFADPVGDLSNSFTEFSNSYASFKKINEFLNNDYSDFNYGNEELLDLSILKTDKLSFSYDGEKKILNDIDFTSFKNGMTAIVGHTGCGKTTLISLLLRLYSNYDGNIYANECEYRNLNNKFLKEISYVSQEPWIFSGTILENLTYGNSNYDINLVYEITKKIGLDSSIKKLKNGYNEIIDSSSNKLSNGQLQMISVSRAMIQNRKFLIMDEPTSNIDIYSELKIKEAIEDLRKDKTTIIIAHRLSTIYKADSIYVIDDGKVLECGTHQELLENDKLYKKLVLSHFITEEKI